MRDQAVPNSRLTPILLFEHLLVLPRLLDPAVDDLIATRVVELFPVVVFGYNVVPDVDVEVDFVDSDAATLAVLGVVLFHGTEVFEVVFGEFSYLHAGEALWLLHQRLVAESS